MKEWARPFYTSPAWRNTRAGYMKAKGGLCERCLAKGLIVPGVIVHHRTHLTPENIKNERVALSWSNLELLCRSCHELEHQGAERRYFVDAAGRVTPPLRGKCAAVK